METIAYSLKVSVVLIAFYLLYKSFMSRETFHRANRVVVLGTIALSFVLPFCGLTLKTASAVSGNYAIAQSVVMLQEVIVGGDTVAESTVNWRYLAELLYVSGIVVCLMRMLLSIVSVLRLIGSGERHELPNGNVLVIVEGKQAPFSWVRYIIMNRTDYEESRHEILTHEQAHIRYRHSIDIMVCDVLCCLQWFNPAMWLMRRELCAIHEYEADEAVLDSGINAKQYQILLIKKAAGGKWYSIANSFNHSKLKYRITMMSRKKSSGWMKAKALYILPVAAFAMIAFANSSCSKDEDKTYFEFIENGSDFERAMNDNSRVLFIKDNENGDPVLYVKEPDGDVRPVCEKDYENGYASGIAAYNENVGKNYGNVFVVVENMPQFPGGELALRKFIAENVKYPQDAKEKRVQGKVFVSFVINEEGAVVDLGLARGSGCLSIDKEALRVVSSLPKFEPGTQRGVPVKVSYTVPINFQLN